MAASSPWVSFELTVPGKDFLEDCREILETLLIFLDIAKTVLNTVKTFLVGIGNPIQALAIAIIALVNSLIESLRQTGLYAWYNLPDLQADPSCKRLAGGYPGFIEKWKGSLQDAQDINRPRPVAGFNTGGFLLFVVDTEGVPKFIQACIALYKLLTGGSLPLPAYPPPANVKALPVGSNGDPLLKVSTWLDKDVRKEIAIEWTLGTNTQPPDSAFAGAVADFRNEFVPPNWLIERTTVYPVDDVVDKFDKPGQLVTMIEAGDRDPRTNAPIKSKVPVFDSFGMPVVLMQDAWVANSQTDGALFQVWGVLGRYRYIDKNLDLDKTYYYRVRAFSGDLDYDSTKRVINFKPDSIKKDANKSAVALEYPAKSGVVIMGQSSPIVSARIPTPTGDFDVIEHFRATFLSAFSLGFALPLELEQVKIFDPVKKEFIPQTDSEGNPILKPAFNDDGDPIPPYKNLDIGKGSVSRLAGSVSSVIPTPIVKPPEQVPAKWGLEAPWTLLDFRSQAGRLTSRYTSLAIEAGSGFVDGFRQLMEAPPPFWPPQDTTLLNAPSKLAGVNTLGGLLFALTQATKVQGTVPLIGTQTDFAILGGVSGISANGSSISGPSVNISFEWTTDTDTVVTFGKAYSDANVRKSVLAAVKYVQTLGYQGVPPDWQRIALLDDLLPWSSRLIYEILDKIQGLVDGFNGLIDEIKQFIDMIIRKIEVLEKFIQFLIDILNLIESLSVGFYFMAAYDLNGGVSDWFSAVDNAGGKKPPSSAANGYTGGICLAFVAPDVTGIQTAFKTIFG